MRIPLYIVINCRVSSCDDNIEQGLRYIMDEAVKKEDRPDMFLARAYETGMNLGTQRKQSYSEAVNWYDKACQMANIENEENKEEYHGTIASWITREPSITHRPPPSSWGNPGPNSFPATFSAFKSLPVRIARAGRLLKGKICKC